MIYKGFEIVKKNRIGSTGKHFDTYIPYKDGEKYGSLADYSIKDVKRLINEHIKNEKECLDYCSKWNRPMSSEQASKYHETQGFVRVELFLEMKNKLAKIEEELRMLKEKIEQDAISEEYNEKYRT